MPPRPVRRRAIAVRSQHLARPSPWLIWRTLSPTLARTLLMLAVAVFFVVVVLPTVISLAGVPYR
ncbi:MAG TPA: hypothetical protein VK867_05630 [Candidatus Limnocylindrales bacterium]|nr:hypothetical protein [Candidatus Limnocylindrales bacterium]